MKKFILTLAFVAIGCLPVFSQVYSAQKGEITFFSSAPIEDITANNDDVMSLLDIEKEQIVFSVPIMEFEFAKELMKEHFNEKYMHSDKFPKSTLKASLKGFDADATGLQKVKAIGELTIHGVTNKVSLDGTMEKKDGKIALKSDFEVALVDYDIDRPQLMWQNIAEVISVSVDITYSPYEK